MPPLPAISQAYDAQANSSDTGVQNIPDAPLEPANPVASPQSSEGADEGGAVVDLDAMRRRVQVRVDELTSQFNTPVRSGRSEPVGYGIEPPEHFDAAALLRAAQKPINWQIENLWTERAKILLASEPKAGKTYFVCDVGIAVAAGVPLWDALKVQAPGPVGIIAAEDDEGEIGRRLQRMCRARGILLSNLPIHWWPGDRIRLNRTRDIDWIRAQIKKYSIKLMIYDPMARLMDGDENSKQEVASVLTPASEITRRDDCSVMIVHHLGKDDPERPKTLGQRVRGSSDIRSWYTTAIFLTGKLSNGRVGVEVEQRTSGRIPNDFVVRADEREDDSVYGLGTIKLVGNLNANRGREGGEATNQQLIDAAAERIMQLAEQKGRAGLTTSEIVVNLGLGRSVMNAALKKLIREDFRLAFEDAKEIPDGKVLIPLVSASERGPRTRQDRGRGGGAGGDVPDRDAAAAQSERALAQRQSAQGDLFGPEGEGSTEFPPPDDSEASAIDALTPGQAQPPDTPPAGDVFE